MKNQDKLKEILIVEDERPMARALELKLTNSGYLPFVAYNGAEAISAMKDTKFALVLLDLMMPVVDGFGVLESMHKLRNKTPVIVLTNLSQDEDEKRSRELGAKEFFVKSDTPISLVISKIEQLVG